MSLVEGEPRQRVMSLPSIAVSENYGHMVCSDTSTTLDVVNSNQSSLLIHRVFILTHRVLLKLIAETSLVSLASDTEDIQPEGVNTMDEAPTLTPCCLKGDGMGCI